MMPALFTSTSMRPFLSATMKSCARRPEPPARHMARPLLGLRKSATSAAGRLSSSSIAGQQRKLRSMAGDLAANSRPKTRGAIVIMTTLSLTE
jgi:hypothetical protein